MKSSLSIWHLLHNVKSAVKISSIFVAFLDNMNFTKPLWLVNIFVQGQNLCQTVAQKYDHLHATGSQFKALSFL